ncbi:MULTISPECIES: helix-turn-helix domain-containing protein [Gordonia]|uniref:helix-turn-helix domain-containing protein n=1 Tax=Gordonia TaxID=2053 RepID=UPI001B34AD94
MAQRRNELLNWLTVIPPVEPGVPPLAFAQLLDCGALGEEETRAFSRIMIREQVDLRSLIQREAQVPVRWFREVYPNMGPRDGFRLGVAFAKHAQLTSFGPLSLPLVSAGSVAEIVELLRFLPLITTALSADFHHGDTGLTITLAGRTDSAGTDCFAVTYGGLAVLRLVEILAGAVPSVELHLTCPAPTAPPNEGDVAHRLVFDAPGSFVQIPAHVLHEVCRFSDPVAYRVGIAEMRRIFNQRHNSPYTQLVRAQFETGPARIDGNQIARELAISVSTLKRHLQAEGTTLRRLRQEFMRERAIVRLLDPGVGVGQIAAELGYCDVASFSHAFTRWVGCSPSHFRHTRAGQQRRQSAAPDVVSPGVEN